MYVFSKLYTHVSYIGEPVPLFTKDTNPERNAGLDHKVVQSTERSLIHNYMQ